MLVSVGLFKKKSTRHWLLGRFEPEEVPFLHQRSTVSSVKKCRFFSKEVPFL